MREEKMGTGVDSKNIYVHVEFSNNEEYIFNYFLHFTYGN